MDSVIVTKDSGKIGRVEDKIEGVVELSLPVILIKRPEIHYPLVVRDLE